MQLRWFLNPRKHSVFGLGANTYSYIRSHGAADCLARLAELGFCEFELMVHPGHLWPAELSAAQRRAIRRLIASRGLRLVTLNMPNIDINIAGAAPQMRSPLRHPPAQRR